MTKIKSLIKKNRFLYAVAHIGKAIIYLCWGLVDEIKFILQRKLSLIGIFKENDRFKKILCLKNKYKGQKCFIVLTGPSITLEDLSKLKNEVTISVNSIVSVFDQTDFRPTYYMLQDKSVYLKLKEKLRKVDLNKVLIGVGNIGKKSGSCITLKEIEKDAWPENWNYYYLDTAKSWFHANFQKNKYIPYFSENCEVCVYDGGTIAFSAIQLAMYMGFTKIYMLGADCNYSGKVRHIGEYDPASTFDKAEDMQKSLFKSYEVAFQYAKRNGVMLYNATRGGMLEVLPRVSLDEALEKIL